MTESEDTSELLFFDTFSHESDADINLDLVQFPKPVFITQVRIIPLGARVQADFPGGVRLGATNPSKFDIEFFVNDLGMPGASAFEILGQLQYNQNDCIHLECTQEKIPTDGLVLRGWYSTITLAVYGILTNSLTENIASPPPAPCEPEEMDEIPNITGETGRSTNITEDDLKEEWKEPLAGDLSAHGHEHDEMEYDNLRVRGTDSHYRRDSSDEREKHQRKSSRSSERSPSSRNRCHSESNEYMRNRERERDRDREKSVRDWSRSPIYSRHSRRKRSERSRSDVEEPPKWPRTPPASIDSPIRPRSPDYTDEESNNHYKISKARSYRRSSESLVASGNTADVAESCVIDDDDNPDTPGEQYEPILSDDEIMGDDQDNESNTNEEPLSNTDEFEQELQNLAVKAKPAIIDFDPFNEPVKKFNIDFKDQYQKDIDIVKSLLKKFELQTKCEDVKMFMDSATTVEEKENFVFLSEQIITQLSYISQNYKRRQKVFASVLECKNNLKLLSKICIIALNFEAACSQPQPAFKIRHIKTGARLMELLAPSTKIFEYLLNIEHFDPFKVVLSLYHQNYMALSIKLLLLRTIYSLLDCKPALSHFLSPIINGYHLILELLQNSKLTRTKYFLQSIIKKLHLNETLSTIHEICTQLFVLTNYVPNSLEPYQTLEACLQQLLDALQENCLSYQQPRRFLPVSKKFEISIDSAAQRIFANTLRSYFQQHSLAESLLLLISNPGTLPSPLLASCLDLLHSLLQCSVGIDYLTEDCFEVTQMLVAILLGIDEVPEEAVQEENMDIEDKPQGSDDPTPSEESSNLIKKSTEHLKKIANVEEVKPKERESSNEQITASTSIEDVVISSPVDEITTTIKESNQYKEFEQLGIELAFKIQTRYHIDAIIFYSTVSKTYESITLATHLHALYSQTCNTSGRQYTVEVLGSNNQMQVFMDLVKQEQRLQAQRHLNSPGAKYKSPVLSYAVDMIDCCVRYCENLDYLIEFGTRILELAKNHETFEPSVSAVLQEMFVYLKPLEAINIFAYDDITPLVEVITRSLEYITTFPGDLIMGLRILRRLAIGPTSKMFKSADTEELKYRYVALQFYAADGMQILIQILEKLCAYFEQPGLHTPALMTIQGIYCSQIILPTLQVMREMLSFAIQCRDVEFKDLTAIDHLMRTYHLMHYFPESSPAAVKVEKAKYEIIQTLLAYTQPNEQDEELLHKSLWTQMIREVLKNIDSPCTFIPGLLVLAELLPLPLPVPLPIIDPSNNANCLKSQAQHLIRERKLWSAHLHPQGAQIARLIEAMAPSSFPQLSDLLTRVCLQLADLAPNMTLLISKTLSDMLTNEWTSSGQQPTAHLARLLQFFARLNAYPSLKISTLSILSGKLWDFLNTLLIMKTSTDVGIKCQISVHRLLESFLDSEISFIASSNAFGSNNYNNPLLNLATALPNKELIPRIVEAIFINLMQVEVTSEVSAMGVRNLVILTEHDITFYHLALVLKQKSTEFQEWIFKIVNLNEAGSYNSNIESLVLLLRSLTQNEDLTPQYSSLPSRALKLSGQELAQIIGCKTEDSKPNVIETISSILERNKEDINETLLNDIKQLRDLVVNMDSTTISEDDGLVSEPNLPQTESIVTQYDARPIFTTYDPQNNYNQMMVHHWLHILNIESLTSEDFISQYERVSCDLTELAHTCLSLECNLSSDCKRVLHLSASPQSNRERTPTAPCFRTRRVEVEPSTGRPEKKIYITSMRGRGFPRPPPSRGDLFRSRPPNTSRPPSLHVDDFLALETCGAQPTGPTGYNKIPPLMRGSRVGRNRGSRISAVAVYRKTKILRTSSPSTWNELGSPHYRSNADLHFSVGPGEAPHYPTNHYTGRIRIRGMRARPYLR